MTPYLRDRLTIRHALRSLLSKEGGTRILLLIKGMNKIQTIKVTNMSCSDTILDLVSFRSITHSNSPLNILYHPTNCLRSFMNFAAGNPLVNWSAN